MQNHNRFNVNALQEKISVAIDENDLTKLPYWKAWPIQAARIIVAVARGLSDGQLSMRAMSLVYTTLLSLVPLLAISFSVLKAFGVHNQIEPLLLNMLAPLGQKSFEITEKIIAFVENIKAGVLGSMGLSLLIYTVISLMQKIENAYNYAWRVTLPRTFAQRFSDYISVIVIGPVLVFSSLGITASAMNSTLINKLAVIEPMGSVIAMGAKLTPYLLVVTAFTFVNCFMPNTKVKLRSALVGAVFAGILWQSIGWAFTSLVVSSTQYTAIYSAFASLIIFMIWVYLSWLILLVGASISFYHQHPEYVSGHWEDLRLSGRMEEKLALLAACLINKSYYANSEQWSIDDLALHLQTPVDAIKSIIAALEQKNLLVRTGDTPPRIIPKRPPEQTAVKDVLDAIRSARETSRFKLKAMPSTQAVEQIIARLDDVAAKALDGYTVKDLAMAAANEEFEGAKSPPAEV